MTSVRFYTLDVFTDRRFGGNPLAVVLGGDGLAPDLMQTIAREFNLSETVFVLPATTADATHRVRIFTPVRELPFAGHPTIGTAILIAELGLARPSAAGLSVVLEEAVGLVPVLVRLESGRAAFAQLTTARVPQAGPAPPPAGELAALLSLPPESVLDGPVERPEAYSCGVPYLMVPVRDRASLARIEVAAERWRRTLGAYWAPDVYAFTRDPANPRSVRARMFATESGIVEDPATGSAAVALVGYLAGRESATDGTLLWTVEQGVEMGRPSLLYLEADLAAGAVQKVRLGGAAVRVAEGSLAM